MPIALTRHFATCGLCVAFAAACTPSSPPATPAPVTPPADSTNPANAPVTWKLQRSAGSWRYELHSTATVTLAADSSASTLPVSRTTIYTVTLAPSPNDTGDGIPFQLTGSVDSVAVTTPERVPTPTAGSNIRPRFRALLTEEGQLIDLTSDATTACQATIDPLSAAAVALFATIPPEVSEGASWGDTVSTVTCRGRMPVITTVRRQYRVVNDTVWGGTKALLLVRTDSLELRNRPDSATTAPGERMTADGSGSGEYTLYVDRGSGMLLNASGQSHTEILVINGDARFSFREDARQTIALAR